jgi:hypothetical protein
MDMELVLSRNGRAKNQSIQFPHIFLASSHSEFTFGFTIISKRLKFVTEVKLVIVVA